MTTNHYLIQNTNDTIFVTSSKILRSSWKMFYQLCHVGQIVFYGYCYLDLLTHTPIFMKEYILPHIFYMWLDYHKKQIFPKPKRFKVKKIQNHLKLCLTYIFFNITQQYSRDLDLTISNPVDLILIEIHVYITQQICIYSPF